MIVIELHRSVIVRQISEAVWIKTLDTDNCLNSNSDWGSSKIPLLVIELGDKVDQAEPSGRLDGKRRKIGNTLKKEKLEFVQSVTSPALCDETVTSPALCKGPTMSRPPTMSVCSL